MAFLRRLFGGQKSGASPAPTATVIGGHESLEVVGESFYQDAIRAIVGGVGVARFPVEARLVREPDNSHDPNAIAIWVGDSKVGHLSREDAAALGPGLATLEASVGGPIALSGVIAGGDQGRPSYGVFLAYDPSRFGLEASTAARTATAGRAQPRVRTGFSNALLDDAADDSYDLGWEARVPADRLRAASYLRAELESNREPISRHFIFSSLEATLYGLRDEIPTALPDFDETCRSHHAEMPVLRPSLIKKFDGLPLLDLYKQSAIRHDKAGDLAAAIEWCDLGIAIYATDALSPEAPADLQRRAEKYRARMAATTAKSQRVPRSRPDPKPTVESLICHTCGRTFERAVTRGRKPTQCPECRAVGSPQA